MKIDSFNDNLNFSNEKIITKVLLETSFSKEIRILMKKGQIMKEHKAPFSIIVHVLVGEIDFGLLGNVHKLTEGMVIALDANVSHDLTALKDSVVRLTLSKLDKVERVNNVNN